MAMADGDSVERVYREWGDEVLFELERSSALLEEKSGLESQLFAVESAGMRKQSRLVSRFRDMISDTFADNFARLLRARGVEAKVERPKGISSGCLVVEEDGSRMGAVFAWPSWLGDHTFSLPNSLQEALSRLRLDRAEVVWLSGRQDDGHFDRLAHIPDGESPAGALGEVRVLDYVERLLGAEEASRMESWAAELAKRAWRAIGYSTVRVPTEEGLATFRRECRRSMAEADLPAALNRLSAKGLEDVRMSAIRHNLVEGARLGFLLGEADYAGSFVASEWRFRHNAPSEGIEQTGTIAGFAKSIEQLLWQFVGTWADKGKEMSVYVKQEHRHRFLPLTSKLLEDRKKDIVLGTLRYFVCNPAYADDFFEGGRQTQLLASSVLNDFARKARNGSFHRANVWTKSQVVEVRELTFEALFLLIGDFKLDRERFKGLHHIDGKHKSRAAGYASFRRSLLDVLDSAGPIDGMTLSLMAIPDHVGSRPDCYWMVGIDVSDKNGHSRGGENCYPGSLSDETADGMQEVMESYISKALEDSELAPLLKHLAGVKVWPVQGSAKPQARSW